MADYNVCFGTVSKVTFPAPSTPGGYYVISATPGFAIPTGVIQIPGTVAGSALGYYYLANHISTLSFRYTEFDSGGMPAGLPITERYISTNCGGFNFQQPCETVATLIWLLPFGGWRSYSFEFRQINSVDGGETQSFINTNMIQRYGQKTGVRNGASVFSGEIPKNNVDYLASLKYSIQAFYWDGSQLFEFNVSPESFDLYASDDRLFRFSFKGTSGKEILIQTQ